MPLTTLDGQTLKEMYLAASALLDKNRQTIDALNVFPVPDGDTGTNMSQTMQAAIKEMNGKQIYAASDVAAAVARGALRGARGNSGVILSQILRGFAKAMEGKEEIDAATMIEALRLGSETAYKAMMKPKEGTILTVQRVIAEEMAKPQAVVSDMRAFFARVVSQGDIILRKTTDMLPVLKQAGVIDSGGKGLMVLYAAFYMVVSGDHMAGGAVLEQPMALPGDFSDDHTTLSEIHFAYCTEYIVSHPRPEVGDADVLRLRRRLERIGDCVLAIGDGEVIKVHVHTNTPNKALSMGLELGELDAIKIDNMLEEFRQRMQKTAPPPVEEKEYGMVSVALGQGLTDIFKDLAVDVIVDGGQTMNPSIDDLITAIERVPARSVFVFPNNSNIILAAQQAAQNTKKTVRVIPTKSVPQGISAAVAFQPTAGIEENVQRMTRASSAVKTGQLTYAVRDTQFDGRNIHEGDIMGLYDGKIAAIGREIEATVLELLDAMVDDDVEMLTLFYGEGLTAERAQALFKVISERYPDCDVELHNGGQPLYYFLISVE